MSQVKNFHRLLVEAASPVFSPQDVDTESAAVTQADIRARHEEEDVRAYREEIDEERKTVTLRKEKPKPMPVPVMSPLKNKDLTVI